MAFTLRATPEQLAELDAIQAMHRCKTGSKAIWWAVINYRQLVADLQETRTELRDLKRQIGELAKARADVLEWQGNVDIARAEAESLLGKLVDDQTDQSFRLRPQWDGPEGMAINLGRRDGIDVHSALDDL